MGDPQISDKPEFWQGIGKLLIGAAYIGIGIMAKLAIDSRSQKLTTFQIIVKVILSAFVGFISLKVCNNTGHAEWAGVVTPISTLLGESAVVYIMGHFTSWADWLTEKLKKKQ